MVRIALLALALLCSACHRSPDTVPGADTSSPEDALMSKTPLLGLRSGIYHVADLDSAKRWYTQLLGIEPYFDEPFYVGFDVGGYELGLNPDTATIRPGPGGALLYWGVESATAAFARLLALGAEEVQPVADVGGDIRLGVVRDPFGNLFGVIENPHFRGGQ